MDKLSNQTEDNLAELLTLRKEVTPDGDIYYFNKEGEIHRVNGPAVTWVNGSTYWFKNGLFHRENGPAIERHDGSKVWWENGKQIREQPSGTVNS